LFFDRFELLEVGIETIRTSISAASLVRKLLSSRGGEATSDDDEHYVYAIAL
jgi:hypothetical protein